jgi:predicted NBD/HSP70 family sugar kinase
MSSQARGPDREQQPVAARPDAIRAHNLGLVLSEIHRSGALTRAELTARLGVSRSTIGALVADLAHLGLVFEHVPSGGERAGRPSHVVGPRPGGPYAVAVDLDINQITTAAVGIGGQVLARHVAPVDPHPGTPAAIARLIVDALPALRSAVGRDSRPVGVAVSVPGTVNRRDGFVEFAPNMGWRHVEFGSILGDALPANLRLTLANDANLAVLAEHIRGAARDTGDVIYLMGRIGVGAGLFAGGRAVRGFDGHAGEVGHTILNPAGPKCHCGRRGCVETYIGEKALMNLAGRRGEPTPKKVADIFAAANGGEDKAAAAVRVVAESLGRTVANLVNMLNPELVVLGGSLAGVFDFARADVERALSRHAVTRLHTELRVGQLGDDAPLLGAAELAFAPLLASPSGVMEAV